MPRREPPSRPAAARPAKGAVAITLILSALILCAPLLWHGPLPEGSDVYATCHYLQGFMKAFSEGDLYPRWTDRTNQDLGAPSFVMFPPLTYYGAGAAAWLTGSTITGFKLYILAVSLLSALSFYSLARQWIGPGVSAALASAAYLLLPYHVLDVYQRFAMSETTAFVFFPLILLFARRTMLMGKPRDFAALALSYAGLIYTHIVSSLSFSLFLGLWLLWESRGRWRALAGPALGLICGAGLAAPALLPAVIEKADVNIAWVKEMPNGDFRINFIFRDELLPGLGIKDPVKPPVLKSAHSQLLLGGLAAGAALAWTAASQSRRRRDVIALAAGCGLAYFMQLGLSTPIWTLVPELATIQFPWRLQTIMVLTASLLVGFALSAGWGRAGGLQASRRSYAGAGAILMGLGALLNLALAAQNANLKRFGYDDERDRSPGVTRWSEPSFTPIGFTRYRDFRRLQVEMPRASFREGTGEVDLTRWDSSRKEMEVRSASGGIVNLRSFWFPGWTGTIDGQPLPLAPSDPDATITFRVPPGSHHVTIHFADTPARRAGAFVGLGSILATALLAWRSPRLLSPGAASPAPPPHSTVR
ncbi:MAG TPA: 6-pyruvoyl-tetrahydropterin synthase-related protein [Candidatus Polarisedimenticolia bacterium]|jgi:hypothetical protein